MPSCSPYIVRSTGVVLSAQELCEMQTPQQPYKLRGVTCHSGDGLLNAFAIADVISAVSGAWYSM